MQVLNQEKKTKNSRKSQLVLIGSFLVFIGVVCLSWNHLKQLREQVFENVRLRLIDDSNGTSDNEEVITSNVENIKDNSLNGGDSVTSNEEQPKKNYNYRYVGYLEISRIKLKRGFVDMNSKYNHVDYNIAIAQGSNYPDVENGNFILMAHSGDAYISYFANLYRLEIGNIAKVTYQNKVYSYKLVKIEEQPKTGVVAIHRDNYNTKALTLITCTKDNDTTQTIYIFELV